MADTNPATNGTQANAGATANTTQATAAETSYNFSDSTRWSGLASYELIKEGMRADARTRETADKYTNDGVECIGNVDIYLQHPLLYALAAQNADIGKTIVNGVVHLTGFKLESTFITADNLMDNAKIVPLLNGDTMTLVNTNCSGTVTIACTRTAAGIAGGDIIAVADFLRKQGDNYGGFLTVEWYLNGKKRKLVFSHAVVKRCQPIVLAGNDIPDHTVQFSYARMIDGDSPVAQ